MNKKPPDNRLIIYDSTNQLPYGAQVAVILDEKDNFDFADQASLLLDDKQSIVRVVPCGEKIHYNGRISQKLDLYVEWFATVEEAEEKKSKLLLALLWAAISRKHPLLLDYQTSLIYDRTQHGGTRGGVSAQLHIKMSSSRLVDLVNQIFSDDNIEVEEKLLVSMDLFTSAKLETSDRAKFVGLVSALEPLAQSEAYGNPELEKLVDNFVNQLTDTSIPDNIKRSVEGRIRDLKKESISQAIQRIVQESIPANKKAVSIIKDAYNIRSTILHDGSTDAELEQKSNDIENIIRQIYSHRLNRNLFISPQK
jgi:uncharacterized protein (UPF0147 family)